MNISQLEIPSFLQEPTLTKPDENAKHWDELKRIANGFDQDDATVVCGIFARKYPAVMLLALTAEMNSLRLLRDDISKSYDAYESMKEVN